MVDRVRGIEIRSIGIGAKLMESFRGARNCLQMIVFVDVAEGVQGAVVPVRRQIHKRRAGLGHWRRRRHGMGQQLRGWLVDWRRRGSGMTARLPCAR